MNITKKQIGVIAGVLGAFAAGVGCGVGGSHARAELKYREKYREYGDSLRRAYETAGRSSRAEAPAPTEEALESLNVELSEESREHNPYKNLVKALEPDVPQDVAPQEAVEPSSVRVFDKYESVNTTAGRFSYIESEEFYSPDDREKRQILIYPQTYGDYLYTEHGEPIAKEEFESLVGESVMADFKIRIPPNQAEKVLYVRDDESDVDYEVVLEQP